MLLSERVTVVLSRVVTTLSSFVNVHKTVGGGMPIAEQLKLAVVPCSSEMLCGGCITTGSSIQKLQ